MNKEEIAAIINKTRLSDLLDLIVQICDDRAQELEQSDRPWLARDWKLSSLHLSETPTGGV